MAAVRYRTSEVDQALTDLERATAADLRRIWRERRGSAPPPTLTARLMRLALAWEVQAEAMGGEAREQARAWGAIGTKRARGKDAFAVLDSPSVPVAPVGTRILKAWGGETHEVVVLSDGVVWKGRTWPSLSALARAMTGTPRNGPKFFGLRGNAQ